VNLSEKRSLLGRKGEDLAASFLHQQGYRLLVRNYRLRYGEIDIIARDGACIAFGEVKTRQAGTPFLPAEAVSRKKQRQIARVAQAYLAANRLFDSPARFDVISVLMHPDGQPQIDHLANAFDLPDSGF
jgi:putative endonuclease